MDIIFIMAKEILTKITGLLLKLFSNLFSKSLLLKKYVVSLDQDIDIKYI